MFGIDDAIAAGSNLITTIVNKIAPDANIEEQNKITLALTQMQSEYSVILAQLKVNESEAQSPHWFVAAARPAVMWVGVISLTYSGLGISLLSWLSVNFGLTPLPPIDTSVTSDILMGLLGLGGLRTYEKTKGVETKTMKK